MNMILIKSIVGAVIFGISFIFYTILFFLLKVDYFIPIASIILILYGLSFLFTKLQWLTPKVLSLLGFITAIALNAHWLGWL